jgi:hypothetical protein
MAKFFVVAVLMGFCFGVAQANATVLSFSSPLGSEGLSATITFDTDIAFTHTESILVSASHYTFTLGDKDHPETVGLPVIDSSHDGELMLRYFTTYPEWQWQWETQEWILKPQWNLLFVYSDGSPWATFAPEGPNPTNTRWRLSQAVISGVSYGPEPKGSNYWGAETLIRGYDQGAWVVTQGPQPEIFAIPPMPDYKLPEPATALFLVVGLFGAVAFKRKFS